VHDAKDELVLSDLIMSLASDVGDIIVITHSYFDESYDADVLCVAGYTFTGAGALELDREWRRMLARYGNLPFFRMSACNQHRWPFDSLTKTQCIAIATDAIGLINKYALFGHAVTIDQKAFNKTITSKGVVSTPYELCSWLGLTAVRAEISKKWPITGMSFFFEAGFSHQTQAERMMKRIFQSPQLRQLYAYKAHTFVVKEDCRPTQAADLLAWQWYKDLTRRAKGATQPRGDLRALVEKTQHYMLHADNHLLQKLVEDMNARAGSPLGNEIAGIAMRNPDSSLFPKHPGESGSAEEYEKLKRGYPDRF
jgi:hypothetical protein